MSTRMMLDGTVFAGFYEKIDGNPFLLAVVAQNTVDMTIWQHTGFRPRFDPVPQEIADIARLLMKALLEHDAKAYEDAEQLVQAWQSRMVQ